MAFKYNQEADAALAKLYLERENPAVETTDKIKVLVDLRHSGEEPNFYALGGEIDDEMKLGCLEYGYLEDQGLLDSGLACLL